MSLRVKFLVTSLAGIAALLLVVLLIAGRWGQDRLERAAARQGEILATSLARATAEQAIVGNYTQTQGVLQQLVDDEGLVYALVLDEEDQVRAVASSVDGALPFAVGEAPGDGLGCLELARGTVLHRYNDVGGQLVLDVSTQQESYGRVWGAVRIGVPLDGVTAAVRALHLQVALLGVIAFALGALVAVFFAGRVVNPLRSVMRGAERVARGDFSARVGLQRRDEIGRLSRSFDKMSAALETHIEEVEHRNQEIRVIYEVLEQLASTIEKDVLLERMLQVSTAALQASECTVLALDERKGIVEVFRSSDGNYEPDSLDPSDADLESFDGVDDLLGVLASRTGLVESPLTALAPISAGDRDLGLLCLQRSDEPFTETDRRLVGGIARHLAVALENARLYEMAIRDGLTDLFIKRYFGERLREEIDRAHRYCKPIGMLMADLDHFKRVNDGRGHLTGDRVLQDIARLLTETVRSSDVVCRFGGEEFALMLPEQDRQTARLAAEKIRAEVARHTFSVADGGPPVSLTISIGVAAYPDDGEDEAELLAAADEALYEAKNAGRNRVVLA